MILTIILIITITTIITIITIITVITVMPLISRALAGPSPRRASGRLGMLEAEGSVRFVILYMRNLLGWLRLGWLKIT